MAKGKVKWFNDAKGIGFISNDEGELEIGQVASLIDKILPVSEIMKNLLKEYNKARIELQNNSLYQFDTE